MTDATRHDDGSADNTRAWVDSFDEVIAADPRRGQFLLERLVERARERGMAAPYSANTPYVNTIPAAAQPAYPGDRRHRTAHQEHHPLERHGDGGARQQGVVRASAATSPPTPPAPRSTRSASTTSSAATGDGQAGDQIYFQGHASPGIYARAFLEGRASTRRSLHNFRRELAPAAGCPRIRIRG